MSTGFGLGVGSLFVAFRRLASTPRLWPHAALPCIALMGVMTLVLVFGADPLVAKALSSSGITTLDTWYGQAGEVVLTTVLWLTGAVVAIWVALVVTPPLCAPVLEHLVRAEEDHLGAPPRPKLSLWFEWRCGLQAQLVSLVLSVAAWTTLTVVSLVLPALVVLTLPLKVVALSAALAWSLLDYPLTLRGIRTKQRLHMFRTQPLAILGFGLPFAFLFWFPFTSVLLLPIGAIAATRVVWQLAERDPTWQAALKPRTPTAQPERLPEA